jgi:hypothetical protein
MDKNLNKLIDIATKARRHIDKWNRNKKAYPVDLCGACGMSSHYLVSQARKYKLYPTLAYGTFDGTGHCWVEYRNHIIDITATQFDVYDDVYVARIGVDKRYAPEIKGRAAEKNVSKWGKNSYMANKKSLGR